MCPDPSLPDPKATKDIILQNLSEVSDASWWHVAIHVELGLYCLAVLCTFPLMMYPPIKITERKLFRDEDGVPLEAKHQKMGVRARVRVRVGGMH